MACPTCDHTMDGLGNGHFWCPRCGTVMDNGSVYVPALVRRVRALALEMQGKLKMWEFVRHEWHYLGLSESIDLPTNRLT